MKSTVENLEPTKTKLTVEVDYDELKPEMAKAYKEIAEQVTIPGFRKGHVPPRIIDQRFGRGAVLEQVINENLPDFLNAAIMEHELRPLGQPDVEVVEIPAAEGEPGGNLVFTAELHVVPEFELPDLEGRTVTVGDLEVSDEDLQAELDDLRGRFATLRNLERAAEDGDYLTLDLTARIGEEEIDALSDVSYELGSATMLEGQDEALQGVEEGDEVVFVSPIRGGERAGEEAQITVKVLGVKERELPEVDDDFAMMVSEFDTAEELIEDTRNQVLEGKRGMQAVEARDLLLDALLEEAQILLPEDVVQAEVTRRVGEDADEAQRAETQERVEADLRQQLLLDSLMMEKEIQVGQQELIDYMMHVSQTFGMDINEMLADQNQVQSMYGEMARTKALVSVLRDTEVLDASGNVLDISEFTVDPAEAQAQAQAEMAAAQAQAQEQAQEGALQEDDGSFAIDVEDIVEEG